GVHRHPLPGPGLPARHYLSAEGRAGGAQRGSAVHLRAYPDPDPGQAARPGRNAAEPGGIVRQDNAAATKVAYLDAGVGGNVTLRARVRNTTATTPAETLGL